MTVKEMIKICDEEIMLYRNAPDKLNDEQQRYLDFFKSVKELLKGGAE